MIDRGLVARVKKVYEASAHTGVDLAEVLAVIQKESAGVPYFYGSEVIFRPNIKMIRDKHPLTEHQIQQLILIPSGELKGKWSKFRYEHHYLPWAKAYAPQLTPAEQALLSCSVGLGQQMLRFVVQKHPPAEAMTRAYKFMGDIDEQIRWVIGNLRDNWSKDRQLVYARYNGGPGVKIGGATYHSYGRDVAIRVAGIRQFLVENKL